MPATTPTRESTGKLQKRFCKDIFSYRLGPFLPGEQYTFAEFEIQMRRKGLPFCYIGNGARGRRGRTAGRPFKSRRDPGRSCRLLPAARKSTTAISPRALVVVRIQRSRCIWFIERQLMSHYRALGAGLSRRGSQPSFVRVSKPRKLLPVQFAGTTWFGALERPPLAPSQTTRERPRLVRLRPVGGILSRPHSALPPW